MSDFTVLYVEDEPLVQRSTSRILRHLNRHRDLVLLEVDCIKHAKELLLCHDISMILCDIMLPDGTGVELHQWITQKAPRYKDFFIFYSGYTTGPLLDYVRGTTCAFIQKPFSLTELKRTWDETIENRLIEDKGRNPHSNGYSSSRLRACPIVTHNGGGCQKT